MRKADELSTTTAPAATASGANSLDVPAPAENKAMSMPLKQSRVNASTGKDRPLNGNVLPTERADANSLIDPRGALTGHCRCSRHLRISTPTAPVAPTMARVRGLGCRDKECGSDTAFTGLLLVCATLLRLPQRAGPRTKKAPSFPAGPLESCGYPVLNLSGGHCHRAQAFQNPVAGIF
jgi:hypothetical protein